MKRTSLPLTKSMSLGEKCASASTAILLAGLLALLPAFRTRAAQVPPLLSYQGEIAVQGESNSFSGNGQFKFALVDGANQSLWSNDGTSTQGDAPQAAVTVPVADGFFSVFLGDASLNNMQPLVPAVFQQSSDVWLRVWFDDGSHGWQQLSPDQRLASVAFAMTADNSGVPDASIGTQQLADDAVTSDKIAPDAVGSDQLSDHIALGAPNVNGSLNVYGTSGVTLRNVAGVPRLRLNGHGTGQSGEITLTDKHDNDAIRLKAHNGNAIFGGPEITIASGSLDPSLRLSGVLGGSVQLYDIDGNQSVAMSGLDGRSRTRVLDVNNDAGTTRVKVNGQGTGDSGEIILSDKHDNAAIRLKAHNGNAFFGGPEITIASGSIDPSVRISGVLGGSVQVYDLSGNSSAGMSGLDGRTWTRVLEITGGSDLSEAFNVRSDDRTPEPGMIVCIDPEEPGRLVLSDRAYDRTAAGVISGAGGVNTGMIMGQQGTLASGNIPVALTGRVYCQVDATYGSIEPGDLITTSETPGHGMKASDVSRAHGAIIGKAMTGLGSGRGLVLVLVSLH